MNTELLLAIVDAFKDLALVALGAVGTFFVTRWSTNAERNDQREQRRDERAYAEQQAALRGELAMERDILERTQQYVLKVVEIAIAMRSGRWEAADELMALTGSDPLNPRPPHLSLIAGEDLRDRWDKCMIETQGAEIARRMGRAPTVPNRPEDVEELVALAADLVVNFHDQERRIARNELPVRLPDSVQRREKRATLASEARAQFLTYVEAVQATSPAPHVEPRE